MGKGTIFSGQPVEKRGFHETLRNGFDLDKPFLSDTYGHRAQSEKSKKKANPSLAITSMPYRYGSTIGFIFHIGGVII